MAGKPKTWTADEVEQFKKLCGIFCTREEIASIMGVSKPTLTKRIAEYFPDTPTWEEAFKYYSAMGKASLRRKQFEMAMSGDRTLLIFLGKNYLGQSDNGAVTEREVKPTAKITTFTSSAKFAKAANG